MQRSEALGDYLVLDARCHHGARSIGCGVTVQGPHVVPLLERRKLDINNVVVVDLTALCYLVALVLREEVALIVTTVDILHRLTRRVLQRLAVRLVGLGRKRALQNRWMLRSE